MILVAFTTTLARLRLVEQYIFFMHDISCVNYRDVKGEKVYASICIMRCRNKYQIVITANFDRMFACKL